MAIRWNDIVLGDDRRVCSSSGVKPKSNVLAKKRGGRGGRVAMVSEGGLTLPHPEAPRFLTLILSANHRHFPLSSFLLLLLLLPMPFHARPCTPSPFSPTFPTFQLQPSQELLYSLDSPRRRPSTFFPSLLPPSSHEPRRHLNSFGELLIPRIDTNFQPVSIALSRVRSVPSERRNSSEPNPCVCVCVCPSFRANAPSKRSERTKRSLKICRIDRHHSRDSLELWASIERDENDHRDDQETPYVRVHGLLSVSFPPPLLPIFHLLHLFPLPSFRGTHATLLFPLSETLSWTTSLRICLCFSHILFLSLSNIRC